MNTTLMMNQIFKKRFLTSAILTLFFVDGPWTTVDRVFGFERSFDFEKDKVGSPAEGIILEGADDRKPLFIVQKEPKEQNQILALCGATFKSTHPLAALAWFSNFKNGTISVKFMHSGQADTVRRAGLMWRYQSPEETYFLECDTVKSVVRLVLMADGKKKKVLEDKRVQAPPAEWLHIQVDFHGDTMKCSFQGQPLFEKQDSRLTDSGKVGIYLDSDVAVLFDDFKIKSED